MNDGLMYYNKIGEEVFRKTLKNGLKVNICRKEGFKKTIVLFGVNFGSIANRFKVNDDVYSVPYGVAHFLEHKMFAMKDGEDATNYFSQLGLEVNAYTDYYQTVYMFSGSSYIDEGINYLLDFVQEPYFTDENVESEKGIIIQELNMYIDNPNDRLYYGILDNMFKEFPVKVDVGGTVESVSRITKEDLLLCYNTFYHPSNMEMVIVGDVDCNHIVNIIEENQKGKNFSEYLNPVIMFKQEENLVETKYKSINMDVTYPKVSVGIKLPFHELNKNEVILYEMIYKIMIETTFGTETTFYQKLLDDNIITGDLSYNIHVDNYGGFITVKSDVNNVDEFIKRISKKILSLRKYNISEKKFSVMKKACLGSFIKALNNIDYIAYNFLDYNSKNCDLFEIIDLLGSLTLSDMKKRSTVFVESALSSFVIYTNK